MIVRQRYEGEEGRIAGPEAQMSTGDAFESFIADLAEGMGVVHAHDSDVLLAGASPRDRVAFVSYKGPANEMTFLMDIAASVKSQLEDEVVRQQALSEASSQWVAPQIWAQAPVLLSWMISETVIRPALQAEFGIEDGEDTAGLLQLPLPDLAALIALYIEEGASLCAHGVRTLAEWAEEVGLVPARPPHAVAPPMQIPSGPLPPPPYTLQPVRQTYVATTRFHIGSFGLDVLHGETVTVEGSKVWIRGVSFEGADHLLPAIASGWLIPESPKVPMSNSNALTTAKAVLDVVTPGLLPSAFQDTLLDALFQPEPPKSG